LGSHRRHAAKAYFSGVVLFVLISMVGMATAASGAPADADRLEMYRATVDAAKLRTLERGGYDVASLRETAGGAEVALVLTGHGAGAAARPGGSSGGVA
jgi:hypothetical protein